MSLSLAGAAAKASGDSGLTGPPLAWISTADSSADARDEEGEAITPSADERRRCGGLCESESDERLPEEALFRDDVPRPPTLL